MRAFALFGMALLLSDVALLPSPAEARRTAIDQDANGDPITTTLGGYCDFDGSDCDLTTVLPYSVDFGGTHGFVNQIQIYGNGVLNFPFSPLEALTYGYNTDVTILAGGNSTTTFDQVSGNEVWFQSARVAVDTASGDIFAEWFTCFTPVNCFADSYSLLMRPTTGGFNVSFRYSNPLINFDSPFQSAVYIGPNNPTTFSAPVDRDFFIPATFRGLVTSSVPEPSVWAMLILGFGFVGASMRRRATGVSSMKKRLAPF